MKFCLSKFWKKSKFMIFASKFSEIFVKLGPFSGQSFKICPKWLFYLGTNIILEKVRKCENIWIIPWETAADLLSVGWIPSPPASFRVKSFILGLWKVRTCNWEHKVHRRTSIQWVFSLSTILLTKLFLRLFSLICL